MGLCFRPFLIRPRVASIFVPERPGTESGRHGLRFLLHDPHARYLDITAVSNTLHCALVAKGANFAPLALPLGVFHGYGGCSPALRAPPSAIIRRFLSTNRLFLSLYSGFLSLYSSFFAWNCQKKVVPLHIERDMLNPLFLSSYG